MLFHPRTAILDDFLPAALHAALTDRALACEAEFRPALVYQQGAVTKATEARQALHCRGDLGPLTDDFIAAVMAVLPQLCADTGVKPFPIAHVETQLVASNDGGFFERHIDTLSGETRGTHADRMLSCVYYFHIAPQRFSGGGLCVYPIGPGAASAAGVTIAPEQNRLIAFPAFVPHEVQPVSCPSGDFAASRFSVNCWLHRARG